MGFRSIARPLSAAPDKIDGNQAQADADHQLENIAHRHDAMGCGGGDQARMTAGFETGAPGLRTSLRLVPATGLEPVTP